MDKVFLKSISSVFDEISDPTHFNNLIVANIIVMQDAELVPYRYYLRIASPDCAEHVVEERGESLEKYLVLKTYDETEITKHINAIIEKCKNDKPENIVQFLNKNLISEETIYWQ